MLWTSPPSHFEWFTDNYGATYSDTGIGTAVTAAGSAHTKGSNTNLINGLDYDAFGVSIMFCGGSTSAAVRRFMADLLIDPGAGAGNAGSSWSTLISNLYVNSPTFGTAGAMGYWFYFPIFIPAGAAIGAAVQCSTASIGLRMAVRVWGKPTKPDLLLFGTKVQTIGATPASTTGTAITPGTQALGTTSASLGTLDKESFWYQVALASNDTSMTAGGYFMDLLANATNKVAVGRQMAYSVVGTAEQAGKGAFGDAGAYRYLPAGEDIYVRAVNFTGAPDSSMTCVAYAVSQ